MKLFQDKSLYVIYSLSIFISSFLLFMVQPMMAKAIMPYLGGAPSLWQLSVAIYQAILLLGYLYAHFMAKWCNIKQQAIIHFSLMLACLLFMPLSLQYVDNISISNSPFLWTVTALIMSVSLPFFILSANSVLSQNWFIGSVSGNIKNPYFLYIISNVGSLLSLLAYPFVFERYTTLTYQFGVWSQIFVVFLLLLGVCVYIARYKYDADKIKNSDVAGAISNKSKSHIIGDEYDRKKPSRLEKFKWTILAFTVSSLMLGTTSYISDDIGGVPMFWIIPLALYLLSFIIAFSTKIKFYQSSLNIQVILTAFIFSALTKAMNFEFKQLIVLHLGTFFIIALNCHKRLFDLRPHPSHLTYFYLFISLGGVLGGIFNGFLAPIIFNSNVEYILILLLATLLRPLQRVIEKYYKSLAMDAVVAVMVFAFIGIMVHFFKNHLFFIVMSSLFIMPFIASSYLYPRRLAIIIVVILASFFNYKTSENILFQSRNFFGTKKIIQKDNYHFLRHGTINHGVQYYNEKELEVVSYYHPAINQIYDVISKRQHKPVAVIGLGTGVLSCLGDDKQQVDFYEIDPQIVKIAKNTDYFSYFTKCPAKKNIIMGDGRIEIAKADDNKYSLIVVDAFTSDAIPFHLLTQEALKIYLQKLTPGGIIAFHVSNKYLNLAPVVKSTSDSLNLISKFKSFKAQDYTSTSRWMIVTQKIENLYGLPLYWKDVSIKGDKKKYLWKDDKYFILDVLK